MKITPYRFEDDGAIPNNQLPLLIYAQAITFGPGDPARVIEQQFDVCGWSNSWRNGVYTFHHYHSTSHEVLGCYSGSAKVLFGGDNGKILTLTAGDIVLIPAGVGHFNIGSSRDFGVVGAYPGGYTWDMQYGRPGERPKVLENIAALPVPSFDPVLGEAGGLRELWT